MNADKESSEIFEHRALHCAIPFMGPQQPVQKVHLTAIQIQLPDVAVFHCRYLSV